MLSGVLPHFLLCVCVCVCVCVVCVCVFYTGLFCHHFIDGIELDDWLLVYCRLTPDLTIAVCLQGEGLLHDNGWKLMHPVWTRSSKEIENSLSNFGALL